MRMGFGLLSLLVVLAIYMEFFKTVEAPQIQVGQKAQQEAQQLSGRGPDGQPAMYSYKAEPYEIGNSFRGIRITDLTPDGPMATYYGLKVGDIVLQIGGMDVVDFGGDYGSAKGMLDQAYQEVRPLLVQRGQDKINLPVGGVKSPLDDLVH